MKDLPWLINAINAERIADAKEYLLQNRTTHLDFSGDKATNLDITKLGMALVGTAVSSLDLSRQDLDYQHVVILCGQIKSTLVTSLNLSCTSFGQGDGIEDIFNALVGSSITSLDVSQNHISVQKVASICNFIPKTNLLKVNLGFEDMALNRALQENQRRLDLQGYEADLDGEFTKFCQYYDDLTARIQQLVPNAAQDITAKTTYEKSKRNSL